MIDEEKALDTGRIRMIAGPVVKVKGLLSKAFVCNALDLAATCHDWFGLKPEVDQQGQSLEPILGDHMSSGWRNDIVTTYNGAQFGLFSQRMLRDIKWKYVWNPTDLDELYDIEMDPWELKNLASDQQCHSVLKEMRLRLLDKLEEIKDPLVEFEWLKYQLKSGHKL